MREPPDNATWLDQCWLRLLLAGLTVGMAIQLCDGIAGPLMPPPRDDARPARAILGFAPADSATPTDTIEIKAARGNNAQILDFSPSASTHGRFGYVVLEMDTIRPTARGTPQVLEFWPAATPLAVGEGLQSEPSVRPNFPNIEMIDRKPPGLTGRTGAAVPLATLGFRADEPPLTAIVAAAPTAKPAASKSIHVLIFEPNWRPGPEVVDTMILSPRTTPPVMVSTILFEPAPGRFLPAIAHVPVVSLETWSPLAKAIEPRLESSEPPLGHRPVPPEMIAIAPPLTFAEASFHPTGFDVPRFGEATGLGPSASVAPAGHRNDGPFSGASGDIHNRAPGLPPLRSPPVHLLVQFGTPSPGR